MLTNLFFNLGNNHQVFTVDRDWDCMPYMLRYHCEMAVSTIEGHRDRVHKDRRNVLRTDVHAVVPVEAVKRWLTEVKKDPSVIQVMNLQHPHEITAFKVRSPETAEL